jgi:hypothetical protein
MKTRFDARPLELPLRVEAAPEAPFDDDDDAEIRYSLTFLGEAVLNDRRGRFRGFGPCVAVA